MMSPLSIRILATASAVFFTSTAALTVDPTGDADALAKAILGPGLTLKSADYAGAPEGSGLYSDGPLGIRDAAVLTSGEATDVILADIDVANNKQMGTAGSSLCEDLANGATSYDAAVLTMEVELADGYQGLEAQFIFATEEYPDYIGTEFNDVMGIYVDGTQIAFDNDDAPITINGPFFSSSNVLTPPSSGSAFNGSTPLLKSSTKASPGTHKVQIAICDIADMIRDSSVFIAMNGCKGDCKNETVIDTPDHHNDTTPTYLPTGTASATISGGGHLPSCLTLTSQVTKTYTTCPAEHPCKPTTAVEPWTYTVTAVTTTPCETKTYTTCPDSHCSTYYSTFTYPPIVTYPLPTAYTPAPTPEVHYTTYTYGCPGAAECPVDYTGPTTYYTATHPAPTPETQYTTYTYGCPGAAECPVDYSGPTTYYTATSVAPTYTSYPSYACPGAPECPADYTGTPYVCPGSPYCPAEYTGNTSTVSPTAGVEVFTGAGSKTGYSLVAAMGALLGFIL